MKKTNTKKSTSTKKSPAPSKAAAKKVVTPKKTVAKPVEKTSTPAVKKTAPKKSVSKKPAPQKATLPSVKSAPIASPKTSDKDAHDGVKMIGILHLVGNLLSCGALGIILVIIYYIFQREKISTLEKDTCFEIINFNLSFLIYSFVAGFSVLFIIGVVLFPIVLITWIVLMIMGFFHHLEGKNYRYPFIIRFFS